MKRILLVTLMILIVLSTLTLAAIDTDLLHVYRMEEASGNITDSVGDADSTSIDVSLYNIDGINNYGINFTAASTDDATMGTTVLQGINNFTVNYWVNFSTVGIQQIQVGVGTGAWTSLGVGLYADNGLIMEVGTGAADGNLDCAASTISAGKWYMITAVYNRTAIPYGTLYLNGTYQCGHEFGEFLNLAGTFGLGKRIDGSLLYTDGIIDEVYIWNRSLDGGEIEDLYASGAGDFYPFAATTATPTYQWPTPADNSNNNTNQTINCTHAGTDVNYFLFINNMSYQYNQTETGTGYFTWATNFSDGDYEYKCSVQNITSGTFSFNTTRTITIDTVSPTITLHDVGTNFSTDNGTIINPHLSNFSINVTFTDSNLYQTLINITNSTDESVYSLINTSITGTTANYTKLIDITSWALGNYTVKLVATDSHTDDEIPKYKVNKGLDYFRYTTAEGNIIKIKSDSFPLTKKTTKLKDRYDFEFNYLTKRDTYKFIIESYNKIDYIASSDYKAHFVIMSEKGGNWIDFENPDLLKEDYKVTRIDDYTYEVEVTAKGKKSFKFSSLGGLNTKEENYLVRLGAAIDVWVGDDEANGTQINATVTIGSQTANTSINVSGARLINITKEITSLTVSSTGYGSEEKSISITDSYHNFSFNMTPVSSTKIYFYDEKSETLISGETFSVYMETTNFSNTYSITSNPQTLTGLPNGLYELKASSSNYPEREYYNVNVSNTTTTNVTVYLANSTYGAEKTFYVRDSSITAIEDVNINFTRTIGGNSITVAGEKTDFDGAATLYLDEDYEYTIIFTKTGYNTKTIDLEPTEDSYVINMISSTDEYNHTVFSGVTYSFEPSNEILINHTNYNFTFTLNSSHWTLTNCTLSLKNGTNILSQTSSHDSDSCYLEIEFNTGNLTNITSEAFYGLDSTYNFTVIQQYSVIYTYEGDFSLKNFLDDLSDLSMAGFDNFGRMIIAFIVIMVILIYTAIQMEFTNKEPLLFILCALVFIFSYVSWFYIDYDPIPSIHLKKYMIFYLVFLVSGGFIVNKYR